MTEPTFTGEVQFRRYSDTSTQGQQVVFAVQDREALESFVGMEGKRFMAVLVQIGDDEQPVDKSANVQGSSVDKSKNLQGRQREHLGDLCYRAVQWCNDPEFQDWIQVVYEKYRGGDGLSVNLIPDGFTKAEWTKNAILSMSGCASRKDLDTDKTAAQEFQRLIVGPWQKYQMARRSA